MVAHAYLIAEMYGDIAAQIKHTASGEGLAEFGRPADAIRFFNKALALSRVSCRYTAGNENFVLVSSHQAAILSPTAQRSASRSSLTCWLEAVEGATFFFSQYAIAAEWRQQPCGEGRIDFLEQLEESDADRVPLADQPVPTGARNLFD